MKPIFNQNVVLTVIAYSIEFCLPKIISQTALLPISPPLIGPTDSFAPSRATRYTS